MEVIVRSIVVSVKGLLVMLNCFMIFMLSVVFVVNVVIFLF